MPSIVRSIVRNALIVAGACLAITLAILAYQKILRFSGNFHTVVAGEFYRSAQLSATALDRNIREYGIKSVLNLRGPAPDAKWYRAERAVTESHGVAMVDFPMSATRLLTPERAAQLLAELKALPKPILVHCLDGADRTGLVSVIYASQVAGQDLPTAEGQLSPLYGHFGIPVLSGTYAMDRSWNELKPFFGVADP